MEGSYSLFFRLDSLSPAAASEIQRRSILGPESPILFSWAFSNGDEEIASDVINSKTNLKNVKT
jgi:hypothetical protein